MVRLLVSVTHPKHIRKSIAQYYDGQGYGIAFFVEKNLYMGEDSPMSEVHDEDKSKNDKQNLVSAKLGTKRSFPSRCLPTFPHPAVSDSIQSRMCERCTTATSIIPAAVEMSSFSLP